MAKSGIRIERCPAGPHGVLLAAGDIERLVDITVNYFPRLEATRNIVRYHLAHSSVVVLARRNGEVVGFAAASCLKRSTPFAGKPLPVIYQRMLYVDPKFIRRGIGARLQFPVFYECVGPFWPFRPFVLVCRTLSAVVAKKLGNFTRHFPEYGVPVPPAVRAFGETLLPLFGAQELDDKFCLVNGLEPFKGADYSHIWESYLRSGSDRHDRLLLEAMYRERDGRIINSGSVLLMVAYAAPLELFTGYLKRLSAYLRFRGWHPQSRVLALIASVGAGNSEVLHYEPVRVICA